MSRDPGQVARLEGWAATIDDAVARCPHLRAAELTLAEMWLDLDPTTVQGPPWALLVGEMPGPRTSPALPMFPYPASSAGGRLWAMSRMPLGAYLGRVVRVNLFRDYRPTWATGPARDMAADILTKLAGTEARVVLCGRRVQSAFHSGEVVPFERFSIGSVELIGIPHPSGRSRAHNDPEVRRRTRHAVQWAARWEAT